MIDSIMTSPTAPGVLLGLHLIGIALAVVVGRRGIRPGLIAAGIAPGITTLWAIGVLTRDDEPLTTEWVWVEGLDLALRFRIDDVALLMTLLVSGIGTMIFLYATGYFSADAVQGPRMAASLLAFSTSMLGLVWADSIWTLFIFWEFTSVTSFLLVGHKDTDETVRTAARRALMITGGGGLALLAGLMVLANETGTTTLTDLPAVNGTPATVAAVLILLGVATKSAQIPFHVWLPGAMKAPTPVSAYLHSATMVKAGVLLLAVTGSAFADVSTWKVIGLSFGIGSMLWGGWNALRHRDAKLILAWGTISQLGLLVTLLSVGTGKAVFAATSLLFAHALFKAALFAVVGEIDVRTGTRDITELGGLSKSMPVATAVAVAAGLSMAGVPPLLGFAAKEAAIEAVLKLSGAEAAIVTSTVLIGAVLTVAYTTRLLIGVFGRGPETTVAPRRGSMTAATTLLGLSSVLGFVFLGAVNRIVEAAATELNPEAAVYTLYRWPGITTGLMTSVVVVIAGAFIGLSMSSDLNVKAPAPLGADMVDNGLDRFLAWAPRATGAVQHGSLPVYLATMALVAVSATIPFLTDVQTGHLIAWDQPMQAVLAAAIIGAAVAGAFVGSRLGAALTLGAVGIGVSGLFILHGAPDLALTQLLVETVIVVGFVLGLGHLGRSFPPTNATWRSTRLVVSLLAGVAVMAALAASSANPTGSAPIERLTEGAVDEGGGKNIVNVILTDLRALDTLGEVVVLAVVAVGILALANVKNVEASQ
jgi:multicomponent Na+:H+ antiporter subunit A